MRVPKTSKGGFSGQVNNAVKDIKSHQKAPQQTNRGIPAVQQNVSNRLSGQPAGKAKCGMDDKMLNRLKAPKRGF